MILSKRYHFLDKNSMKLSKKMKLLKILRKVYKSSNLCLLLLFYDILFIIYSDESVISYQATNLASTNMEKPSKNKVPKGRPVNKRRKVSLKPDESTKRDPSPGGKVHKRRRSRSLKNLVLWYQIRIPRVKYLNE